MAKWIWKVVERGTAGICTLPELDDLVTVKATITVDTGRMSSTEFNKMCNVVQRGYMIQSNGTIPQMLWIAAREYFGATNIAKGKTGIRCPGFLIGYVGKRNACVMTPFPALREPAITNSRDCVLNRASEKDKVSDIVATALMLGVDMSSGDWVKGLQKNSSHSYYEFFVAENGTVGRFKLQSASNRLAPLFQKWGEETYHVREQFHHYVLSKPVITYQLNAGE